MLNFDARNLISCPEYPYCLWPIETVLKLAVWAHSGSGKLARDKRVRIAYFRHQRFIFSKVCCSSFVTRYRMPLSASRSPRGVFGCTSPNISKTYGNCFFSNLNIQIGPKKTWHSYTNALLLVKQKIACQTNKKCLLLWVRFYFLVHCRVAR